MKSRWAAIRILTPGLVMCLGLTQFTCGQPRGVPAPGEDGAQPPAMFVPPGRETVQALQHAREALQQGRTADGIQLLQRLIELPEDYFTDSSMRHTLKSETLQILEGLTDEQREAYDLLRGKAAAALLDEAKTEGDAVRLADVFRRFPMTAGSVEAGEMLALAALDQGRPWHAAVLLSQLRRTPTLSQGERRQLAIREAFAWQAAGQTERSAELLVEFTSPAGNAQVHVGDRALPKFDDAQAAARWLAQVSRPLQSTAEETANWLSPRGNSAGAIRVKTSGPVGGPLWRVDALALAADDLAPRDDVDAPARMQQELARAEAPLRDAEHLLWTTTVPLVVNDLIVFRTARDVVALDRQTGEIRWRSVLTDPDFETLWNAELTRAERINLAATSPVAEYLSERYYEDRTFGSLSSDSQFVFAIEGLGYVSNSNAINEARAAMQGGEGPWGGSNRLTAYELDGGRLAWEIGGDRAETAGDFAGHFFLGPPIAVAGQLLILAEVQGDVRLVVLQAEDRGGKKIWSQPIAAPSYKITEQDDRRRLGLMPAYSDGVVICPTDAGVTVAVDLLQRRLLWAYRYQSTAATNGNPAVFGPVIVRPHMAMPAGTDGPGWADSTPVIAGGRVFLTPSDSDELHCVQLADGKLLWKIPRAGAAYLAGADAERAVVIGPGRIEAVQAANNGLPAWKEPLAVPDVTGRGVWLADRYLVPLITGEIASIDLASGRMLARSKLPASQLPGHLATGSGALVSLSARDVLSFRSQREIDDVLTKRLASNPDDPMALALRGEERLHRGERDAGLADLRAAVARQADRYAKSVLASALLEGLRNDFSAHRDAIAELDALTDDPDQRTEFMWLVARGLRKTGNRRAAFDRMLPLVDQSLDEITPDGVGNPWSSRADRRLAGHFSALYRDATPEERGAFDQSVSKLLPTDSAEPDEQIKSHRRFLRVFGFHPKATVVRQKLVGLLEPAAPGLEYPWQLSALAGNADAATSAPAAAKLAKWYLAQRRYDDVTPLLGELEGRYAEVACEPDLTGRQLAAHLREDAGYIAHGKEILPWPEGKVEVERVTPDNNRMVRATIVGKVPQHYQGWSFETDQQGTMLFARDHLARQRWRLSRAASGRQPQQVFGEVPAGMHRVHLFDHLIGWSTGADFLIAADLEAEEAAPKILWHDSLVPPGTDPSEFANHVILRRGAIARRRMFVNPATQQRGGELVGITRSAVVFHNGRKLVAAEPLTGKLLWSRNDLPAGNLAISAADDQAISLIEAARAGDAAAPMVRRLRAIDGEPLPAVPSPRGVVQWIGGSRVLHLVPGKTPDLPRSLELLDLDRGEPVWQADIAAKSVLRSWNQSEVYVLEENRRLSLRDLADGAIRWTQEFDFQVSVEAMFAQPWKDRVLIVLGSTTPAPAIPGSGRAVGFNPHDVPISGYAVAVEHATGAIAWQRAINELPTEPTVFDPTQPTGWPVLVFAGRLFVTPEANNQGPIVPRLTATFIDKQTGQTKLGIEEPSNIGMYFIECDPDRDRLKANFANIGYEFHYTGK